MNKYKIIANPAARSGGAYKSIPKLEQALSKYGIDYDLVKTTEPLHAKELTRQAIREGYDVVVAAGGDGTSNEVINGIMEAKNAGEGSAALGALCIGRGNDFAYSMNIPVDMDEGCQNLLEDHRRIIDIGKVTGGLHPEGRYFGNCVGIGFDAIATIEASKLALGGFLTYMVAVLRSVFLYYKGPKISMQYDGNELSQPTLMVSIMNGRRLGGGFWMAPDSKPDDGLFDLCIADEVSPFRIITLIPYFLRGTQATQKEIKTAQAARISIRAVDGSLPTQTDGEIISIEDDHLEIEIHPRQLEIICRPPGIKQ
jgi:YegS/Rv2252/BmrU family lipid kinase